MTENYIAISDTLSDVASAFDAEYVAHAYCLAGSCRLVYNEREIELTAGDLMIVRQRMLVGNVQPSEDFRVKVIYVENTFLELATPLTNYGMRGSLSLFLDPVMHLDDRQQARCLRSMDEVESRWTSEHHFKRDVMIAAVQAMFLDFFDFHASQSGQQDVSAQNADIMSRFLQMLYDGVYRKHREVGYYADKLFITPKYLSEVSKKVSGMPATYWIARFTALDISRLLRDRSLSFVQISNMFGFSSPAYFTRYVKESLGMTPTEFRE